MAKHAKKAHSGKRRGSSKKTDLLIKLAAVGVGYMAADKINEQVDKIVPKTKDANGVEKPNDTVAMAGELGIGGLLLIKKFNIGGKVGSMVLQGAGGILAGAGLKRALKKLGVISGYQNTPVVGSRRHRMAGYQSTPVVAGMGGVPSALSGTPAALRGYRPTGSGVGGYNSQGSGVMGNVNGSSHSCDD